MLIARDRTSSTQISHIELTSPRNPPREQCSGSAANGRSRSALIVLKLDQQSWTKEATLFVADNSVRSSPHP